MKKTLFFLALCLSFSYLYAQNTHISTDDISVSSKNITTQTRDVSERGGGLLLWDNTNINEIGTLISSYWQKNDNWAWTADDFIADGPWIIEKVIAKGYNKDDGPLPKQMALVIYKDGGDIPGEIIFQNMNIDISLPIDTFPEMILPQPFKLPEAGKYWITIAGSFDLSVAVNSEVNNGRWDLRRGSTQIGSNFKFYDKLNLFSVNGTGGARWLDATEISPGSFSMYFKIIGDPGIVFDCEPVKNLTVEYDKTNDCKQAELTWDAPETGSFEYKIFRDGDEIAIVGTESYIDVTFEPTLGHTWGVQVVCNGYTPLITVEKDFCKEPDCSLRPKNLTIAINQNCDAAVLEWHAPTEVLWDNVQQTNQGYKAFRCLLEAYSRVEMFADDFVINSGETWHISEIYYGGFYLPSGYDPFDPPDYIGVEIFKDSGSDSPGVQVYENEFLTTVSGSYSNQQTLLLPEMIKLDQPGKYWIAIYGVYDALYDETVHGFWIYSHTVPIETNMYAYDESSGTWEPHGGTSMYFRLQGYKEVNELYYNIYRDGIIIAEKVSGLTYSDSEFNPYQKHSWAVKTVCLDGTGVSAPVYLTLPKCAESVFDKENNLFSLFPNPTTGNLNIIANCDFSKVEVINFLGQIVVSESNSGNNLSLNVSNLNSGIYFVRITTGNGTDISKFIKQ